MNNKASVICQFRWCIQNSWQ